MFGPCTRPNFLLICSTLLDFFVKLLKSGPRKPGQIDNSASAIALVPLPPELSVKLLQVHQGQPKVPLARRKPTVSSSSLLRDPVSHVTMFHLPSKLTSHIFP